MSSVDAILRVPTDEVQSCPQISTDDDVTRVVMEIETILRKCLYAVRYSLATPFTAFLQVLFQVSSLQCERMASALMSLTEDGRCVELLGNLTEALLSSETRTFRCAVKMEFFFEVLQLLCSVNSTKERFAEVLIPRLLTFLCNAVETEDDYRQPRACASVLITLLRGSKSNKNRMSVECGRIGEALTPSVDIFFQMQCVEILFRLYTHNRTVLATSTLPDFLKKGIAELPNDATLLINIQSLLDAFNTEENTTQLVQFTVLHIEVGSSEVCDYTSMYFSPLILVVMLPGGTGDNITIPYEHIRSVKLSKDRKLGLRLHIIPAKLSHMMDLDTGKDTLMVSLTQSTLNSIRSSGIHEWIAERKRNVPVNRIRERVELPVATSQSQNNIVRGTGKENNYSLNVSVNSGCAHNISVPPSPVRSENQSQPQRKRSTLPSHHTLEDENVHVPGHGVLDQVHAAASQKVARIRQDHQVELQQVVDYMQEELNKVQRVNARERDDFETSVREDLTSIRRAEAQVKDRATQCVQALNVELSEVQSLGEVLKAEIDKVREQLAAALKVSHSVEEQALVELKTMVDGEMKSMEESLLQLVSSTNPLSFLTTYLSRKIDINNTQ